MTIAIPDRVLARFWDRVEIAGEDECWLWKLSCYSKTGYGQCGWWADGHSVSTTAHSVAWTARNGPVPEDLTIDHICRVRACCNPRHLRLLTRRENASNNGFKMRTHCPHGHPYDEENTAYRKNGNRHCRECLRTRWRQRTAN